MNSVIQSDLSEAFTEVRKAYRLLYLYQRRVLDTVKYITDNLGIKVQSGWSLYSANAPKNGKSLNLDSWAWDWLNMYMYEFYCGVKESENDKYQFAIQLQSDTGSYDSWVDGTNVENFGSVEKASTRILFLVGKNRWKNEDEKNKSQMYYENIPALKANGNPVFTETDFDTNQIFILKSYPLELLHDESSILEIIADFKSTLTINGLEDMFKL